MINFIVKFSAPQDISPFNLDGKVVRFPFSAVEDQYVGTPRQSSQTKHGRISVQASGTLLAVWGVSNSGMVKVLYQVAKEHLIALLDKSGYIAGDISLVIGSDTHTGPCPFDIALIEEPQGAVIRVEVSRPIGFL